MIHSDDTEDAEWAAYALLVGKALSCARDSERVGDLAEAGAAICMRAATHVKEKVLRTTSWPSLTIFLFKARQTPEGDGMTMFMPDDSAKGKPN